MATGAHLYLKPAEGIHNVVTKCDKRPNLVLRRLRNSGDQQNSQKKPVIWKEKLQNVTPLLIKGRIKRGN